MAAILLRRDPSLTDVNSVASIYPNEKPTDINRDATTYQKRKQHHTKKLTEILPEILTTADDTYAYNQFCNELNDCYDTDMLLQICITFENKIKDGNNKRYAEYLFAKLAAWAAQEARLCNYIVQLQNNQTAEGASTLVHALTTLNRQNFFKTLNSELNPNQTARLPFTTFHSDQDVLGFLAGIHQPSSRKIIKQQLTENNTFITANKSLLDTNDLIQQAINNIAIFPWDKLTQKQKFIHKVVDALKQPGKTVSINTGVLFSQKSFTFNRKELLVLIRTNPALCAEYQKIANINLTPDTLFSKDNTEMLQLAKRLCPTLSPTPVVRNVVQVIQQHPDSINFAASAHAITALLARRQLPPNTPPNNNGRHTPIATPVDLGILITNEEANNHTPTILATNYLPQTLLTPAAAHRKWVAAHIDLTYSVPSTGDTNMSDLTVSPGEREFYGLSLEQNDEDDSSIPSAFLNRSGSISSVVSSSEDSLSSGVPSILLQRTPMRTTVKNAGAMKSNTSSVPSEFLNRGDSSYVSNSTHRTDVSTKFINSPARVKRRLDNEFASFELPILQNGSVMK